MTSGVVWDGGRGISYTWCGLKVYMIACYSDTMPPILNSVKHSLETMVWDHGLGVLNITGWDFKPSWLQCPDGFLTQICKRPNPMSLGRQRCWDDSSKIMRLWPFNGYEMGHSQSRLNHGWRLGKEPPSGRADGPSNVSILVEDPGIQEVSRNGASPNSWMVYNGWFRATPMT